MRGARIGRTHGSAEEQRPRQGNMGAWSESARRWRRPSGAGSRARPRTSKHASCSKPRDLGGSVGTGRSGGSTRTPRSSSARCGRCSSRASTRWRWRASPTTPTTGPTPGVGSSAPPASSRPRPTVPRHRPPRPARGFAGSTSASTASLRTAGRYDATDPHLLQWVHLAEVDSFLAAYQRFGERPLDRDDRDAYVADMAVVAGELGVIDPPRTRGRRPRAPEGLRARAPGHA